MEAAGLLCMQLVWASGPFLGNQLLPLTAERGCELPGCGMFHLKLKLGHAITSLGPRVYPLSLCLAENGDRNQARYRSLPNRCPA